MENKSESGILQRLITAFWVLFVLSFLVPMALSIIENIVTTIKKMIGSRNCIVKYKDETGWHTKKVSRKEAEEMIKEAGGPQE